MDNTEKIRLIASAAAYWEKRYPNAFITQPNGDKIIREELIDFFQDSEIRDLKTQAASAKEVIPKLIARIENLERRPLPGPMEVPKPVDIVPIHRRLTALEARPLYIPPPIQLAPPPVIIPPRWPIIVFAAVWPLVVAAAYYMGTV